jgi:plastocyanin
MRHSLTAALLLAAACAVLLASCGDESTGSQTSKDTTATKGSAVVFEDDYVFIPIEAESAEKIEGEIMKIVADEKAWGGKCIEIPDEVGTPKEGKFARAVYKFTIKTPGNYTFWCRRLWYDPPPCGDTFAVRFDREGVPRKDETEFLFGADDMSRPPRWDWTPVRLNGNPRQFFFDAGEHVMEILNLEDGPRFDVLLLTDDRDFVPYRGLVPEDLEEE